jgi:hypothetical protein
MKPTTHSWYGRVVAALVATLTRRLLGSWPDDEVMRHVTEGIILAVARMPFHLRVPMMMLTILFDIGAIILEGRLFRRCANPAHYLAIWSSSRLQIMRDFVAFHESVFLLRYYSPM